MLPGALAMTAVAALLKCYRTRPTMLDHPLCRFLAYAIVPNCGGSGEKRLPLLTGHAVACAKNKSVPHTKKAAPLG
jgi:hypothetical protein